MTGLALIVLAAAADPFTASRVIEAGGSPRSIKVSAQRTVRLNDREANALLEQPGAGEITVRAAATAGELTVQVDWPDATRDLPPADEVNQYADAVALEIPVEFGAGKRLPYVGMGDAKSPVRLWQQRATSSGSAGMSFIAAGFGSLTRTGPTPASMRYDERTSRWSASFKVPRPKQALVPVAFAIWDGARKERGGYKQLSGWAFVKLPAPAVDAKYLSEVSWGFGPEPIGNAAAGKPLAEAVCSVCHHLPGKRGVPQGLAPDLSDVGAIALPAYLRDSLVDPSGVVVHHLHLDRRYDKSGERDVNGAYPPAQGFAWAVEGDAGTASRMPSFSGFNEQQVRDIVAFLLTLQGESR
mgnify:CR=1 FL=1